MLGCKWFVDVCYAVFWCCEVLLSVFFLVLLGSSDECYTVARWLFWCSGWFVGCWF